MKLNHSFISNLHLSSINGLFSCNLIATIFAQEFNKLPIVTPLPFNYLL